MLLLVAPSRYLYFLQSDGSALDITVVAGPVSQFSGAFPSGTQAATDLDFMNEAALEEATVGKTLRLFSGAWKAKKVFPLAIALGPCTAGKYALATLAACVSCPFGTFGSSAGLTSAACTGQCGAGYYGASTGQVSSTCTGDCSAGYACVAGSTNATAAACPAGRYSLAGAAVCTNCSTGLYGATATMSNASCSGPCDSGRHGSSSGLTTSTCTGDCSAGYACVAGSTNATAAACPAGRYSLTGAGACTDCPGGTYSNAAGTSTATCTGNCTAGFACPAGSTSPTAVQCTAGRYSSPGAAVCSPCVPGTFASTVGQAGPCTSLCQPGTYCPSGAVGPVACPAGRFGATAALEEANCTDVCSLGHYCMGGTSSPEVCPAGMGGGATGWVVSTCINQLYFRCLSLLTAYCAPLHTFVL